MVSISARTSALGARPASVPGMVLRSVLRMAAIGAAIGIGNVAPSAKFLEESSIQDPPSLVRQS